MTNKRMNTKEWAEDYSFHDMVNFIDEENLAADFLGTELFRSRNYRKEDFVFFFNPLTTAIPEERIENASGMLKTEGFYLDDIHRERFLRITEEQRSMNGIRCAAAYLLSSSDALFEIYEKSCDGFENGSFTVSGTVLSEGEYLLLSAVKDLGDGGNRVLLSDLADEEICDSVTLFLVLCGILVLFHGSRLLEDDLM